MNRTSFYKNFQKSEIYHFSIQSLIGISNVVNYAIKREENNWENCQIIKANYSTYSSYNLYAKAFEFFESERDILNLLTKFLIDIFNSNIETLETLYIYNDLEGLLKRGLLKNDNNLLKESLFSFIQTVFLNQKFYQNRDYDPRWRLGKLIILDLLVFTQYIDPSENKTAVFFNNYRELIQKIDLAFFEENQIIALKDIFDYFNFVLLCKKQWTHLIYEILILLLIYLSRRVNSIANYVKNYELIQILAKNYIFSQEKNKNQNILEQVMKVLLFICQSSYENFEEFMTILTEKMKEGSWRNDKKNSWDYHPHFKEKSLTGYVGLKNLGCSK